MTDKQQLDAQLTEVLKCLPGWKLDPAYAQHTWCAVLVDGEGRGIHVNATQAKGRLYLSVSRGEIGGQFRGELGATFPEVASRNSQRPKGLGVAAVSSHWPPPRRESGIFLSRAQHPPLSGVWPQTSDREYSRPDKCLHITVGRDRPPEKIAAEITRRFLPWYLAAYTEEAERVRQHDESRNRQQELTVELAALLGPDAHKRLQMGRCQVHAPGLSVDVHGNGDVSIEIRYRNVKVATAVLKAYMKAGGLTE